MPEVAASDDAAFRLSLFIAPVSFVESDTAVSSPMVVEAVLFRDGGGGFTELLLVDGLLAIEALAGLPVSLLAAITVAGGSSSFMAAALPPNNPSNAALAFTLLGAVSADVGVGVGGVVGVDVDDNAAALPPNNPSNAALAFTLLGAVSVSVVFFPPNKPSNAALAFILPVGLVMPSPSLLC